MTDENWKIQKNERCNFNTQKLKKIENSYVAWVDVLGTKSALYVSLAKSANFVMKIHVAILRIKQQKDFTKIECFPMNDGVFIRSDQWDTLCLFLNNLFRLLANTFICENIPENRFIIKGSVAYGPLATGTQLSKGNRILKNNITNYTDRILIGMPVAQAYESESKAPPFGILIHESARAFAPPGENPISKVWLKWWDSKKQDQQEFIGQLYETLKNQFDWAKQNPATSMFPSESLDKHTKYAEEYFRSNR